MIDLGEGNIIDGYSQINVILGKNGSGKSTLLRDVDRLLSQGSGCVRYITPERGGELTYDGNIETNRASMPTWFSDVRRNNRFEQFRQSSVGEFRNLETLALRSIESNPQIRKSNFMFDTEIERINKILDRVQLSRTDVAGFSIIRKDNGVVAKASDLSSGESELISLAVEILYYAYLCKQAKFEEQDNWLLLDEPDVHLHPDLQYKLMQLLVSSCHGLNGKVMIATHSTVILSSLSSLSSGVMIGMKKLESNSLSFQPIDEAMQSVMPVFGAHPLSNVFNSKPPLIVEGEDDERIWQTAVRSSRGRIALFPCVATNIQSMNHYEVAARGLILSVYDHARAFSLRDRDDSPYEIDDLEPVVRMRLSCRNAENLILTDDVLSEIGTNWNSLCSNLEKWMTDNPNHSRASMVASFRNGGWDRKNFQLKALRMLLVGLTGSEKPWEVAVGQAIARMVEDRFDGEHSLRNYLGPKAVDQLKLMG